jgi:uncharacterized protein (TIGR02246 family)
MEANSSTSTPALATESADEWAIQEILANYQEAVNAANTAAIISLYATDGVFMPLFSPSAVGASAIRSAYEAIFNEITLQIKFAVIELVKMSPEWAFVRTNSAGTIKINATGALRAALNQELFIFRQGTDRRWTIARYSFSPTRSPQFAMNGDLSTASSILQTATTDEQRKLLALEYLKACDNGGITGSGGSIFDLFTEEALFFFPKWGLAKGKGEIKRLFEDVGSKIRCIRHDYAKLRWIMSDSDVFACEGETEGEHQDGPWKCGSPEWGSGRFCNVFEVRDPGRYPWLAATVGK